MTFSPQAKFPGYYKKPSPETMKKNRETYAKLYPNEIKWLSDNFDKIQKHNKFLLDRLEIWAERNFQERQKRLNITVDEVVAMNKDKADYKKDKELAITWEEQSKRASQMDTYKANNR